jgi:Uma2 family endonuclease
MSILQDASVGPPETRLVLENVAWSTFVELADQRRGSVPRMTYDNGVLEMMSPKRLHENLGCLIGRMIEAYSEAKSIEIISVASVTVKRSDLKKAFEADESYYVAHANQVFDKEELDFEIDPPPDLVIEVEITSSAIEKMKLFAMMRVPEVWRHDGAKLEMFRLVASEYQSIESSIELLGLKADLINQTLAASKTTPETKLIQGFRQRISDM